MIGLMHLALTTAWLTTAGATPTWIDVTDFGAVPDNGEDDTLAVMEAIAHAHEVEYPVVRFPKGRYHFAEGANAEDPRRPFIFREIDGLVVEGEGAELIFSGLVAPFHFSHCSDVTVRGLTIDWDRPPFSAGEIVAIDGLTFDVRVFDDYPVEGGEPVQAFQDFDPETRLPRRLGVDSYYNVDRTELVAPQTLRIYTNHPTQVETGYWAVLRHQVYAYNAFYFGRCEDVRLEDITIYTVPGMGVVADTCHNVTLERFNVLIRPDSDRLMSATADGSHFSGCTGLIRIDNCEFEGMGDDAVNIKTGLYLTVREQIDDQTVIGRHNLDIPTVPDVGDILEFSPTDTLLMYGQGEVEEAELLDDGNTRVRFTEPLPAELEVGHVLGNASRVARAHISNTHVRRNRARGFLIQIRDALIEDCTFTDITTAGVFVMTEVVHFYESIAPRDIVVRNNIFENCNFGNPPAEGVIMVYAYLHGFEFPPKPGVIKNITLENNTIRGGNSAGIFVSCTDGIVIRDNVIEDVCHAPHRDIPRGAIYIMSTRNAEITGNTVKLDRQGPECDAPLLQGAGNEEDTFVIEDNVGF